MSQSAQFGHLPVTTEWAASLMLQNGTQAVRSSVEGGLA